MGIGRALCQRFATEGASVVVADREIEKAEAVAAEVGGLAVKTDVSIETDIINLVEQANAKFGQIDLFCSNAGIGGMPGGAEVPNQAWGYLLQTASAAGLLTQVGSAPYSVTKHAAVAFAEWLSITYGDKGIKVSCLCPQGVRTRMLLGEDGNGENFLVEGSVSPEEVAEVVVAGLAEEKFLILPHPEVAEYIQRKAGDYDRWIRGMRRLQAKVL